MSIQPNRAVTVLTPLVFAPLAGAISVAAARYMPGVDIDTGQLQAIFIAGATIATAKAGLWLKGWQDFEKAQGASTSDATGADAFDEADALDQGQDFDDVGAAGEDAEIDAETDIDFDDEEVADDDMVFEDEPDEIDDDDPDATFDADHEFVAAGQAG